MTHVVYVFTYGCLITR